MTALFSPRTRTAPGAPAGGRAPRRGGLRAAAVALLAAAGTAAATPGLADGAAPDEGAALGACGERAVDAVQRRYEGLRDLSARFEQTTRSVALGATPGEPTPARGRVVLAKPGKMRWTYESPEESLVVSDGETLWIYDPALREAQRLPMTEGFLSGAAAQFLLGAGEMRRDFAITVLSCEPDAAQLELVPREPATYEKIVLLADPESGEVRRTRVVDLVGNVSVVELHDVELDQEPPPETFRFEPPEGVKVLEPTG